MNAYRKKEKEEQKSTIWDRLGSVAAFIWESGPEVGSEPVPGVMAVAAR